MLWCSCVGGAYGSIPHPPDCFTETLTRFYPRSPAVCPSVCLSVCPSVCLSVPPPHTKPAAMLFTCSPVFLNFAGFLIVDPLPHVSVCLLPSPWVPYHVDLPRPLLLLPPSPPSPLQPLAPSQTSPDEFPMNVKQAYKAFAAVPRSLAVLEPPQVGPRRPDSPGSQQQSMLC